MIRRALLAASCVALAIVAHWSMTSAADWRPVNGPRLVEFDAAMAPHLAAHADTFAAIQQDFGVLSEPYRFAGIEAAEAQMQARVDAARQLPRDVAAALALAHDAIAVTQAWTPEPCWEAYWAAMVTGWTAYGDAADQLSVGAMDDANTLVGVALYLLGDAYGGLLHRAAEVDCA